MSICEFQSKSCRDWCKFKNSQGSGSSGQIPVESRSAKFCFTLFLFLICELKENTQHIPDVVAVPVSGNLQWRQMLSDLEIKITLCRFARRSQHKEVCFKVMLEKSSKIYYLPCGLLPNLRSSEEGKTTYNGCGTRKKKLRNWVGGKQNGRRPWKLLSLPLLCERPAWTLNFLSYVGVTC